MKCLLDIFACQFTIYLSTGVICTCVNVQKYSYTVCITRINGISSCQSLLYSWIQMPTHIAEALPYQNICRLTFISYIGYQATYLLTIISNPWSMDPGCLISTDTEQEASTRFPLHIHNLTKMTSHSHIWFPCPQLLPKEPINHKSLGKLI
jgi:hypothetical protein